MALVSAWASKTLAEVRRSFFLATGNARQGTAFDQNTSDSTTSTHWPGRSCDNDAAYDRPCTGGYPSASFLPLLLWLQRTHYRDNSRTARSGFSTRHHACTDLADRVIWLSRLLSAGPDLADVRGADGQALCCCRSDNLSVFPVG